MIRTGSSVERERLEQRLALLGSNSPNTSSLTDTDVFNGSARLDLADTGKRLENRQYFDLASYVIGLRLVEQFLKGQGSHLEALLEFGTAPSGRRRLFECCGTLLGGQFRWQRHATSIFTVSPVRATNRFRLLQPLQQRVPQRRPAGRQPW